MAIWFCDAGSGNDSNDGRDNIGVNLSGTVIWTESTFTITESAGHGYTFAAGDVIYVDAGTGVTVGLYEVVSSTSTTIVLKETSTLPTVGNASDFAAGDLATGDITSSTGPELTIQAALAELSAGDTVWVRGGTDYNEQTSVATVGTLGSPVVVEGYTTTLGDEGVAVNDGTTGTLAEGFNPASGSNFYVLKNLHFKDFTGTGCGDLLGDHLYFYRVEASGNGSGGIEVDDASEIVNCHSHDNTGDGIAIGSFGTCYKCISQNNTGDGIEATAGMAVIDCLIYENSLNGINWIGSNAYGIFVNNTVVASSASGNTGIELGISNTANRFICANNSVSGYSGSGGKGIDTAIIGQRAMIFNNNLFNNETNYDNSGDLGGGTTGNPSFVNSGADDYTPASSSPLIVAGLEVADAPGADTQTTQKATVGALLRAVVATGGGLLMPNKRGNMQ